MGMTQPSWYLCWNGDLLISRWDGCWWVCVRASTTYFQSQGQEASPEAIRDGYSSFSYTESLLQIHQKLIPRDYNVIFLQNCLPFFLHFPLQTDLLSVLSVCTEKIFSPQLQAGLHFCNFFAKSYFCQKSYVCGILPQTQPTSNHQYK